MRYTFVIVGGGSAGCVLANRLSADPDNSVLLLEAGQDTPPDGVPADIADSYPGRAAANAAYLWSDLRVSLAGGRPVRYEQARVMGGGSSVNGQVATRGAAADYDRWVAAGAQGWGWTEAERCFRRIERDRDFVGETHGSDGPIPIRRLPRSQWDGFSEAVARSLDAAGEPFHPDLNGGYADGYGPLPISNADGARVSAAAGFLGPAVRRRPNLVIRSHCRVRRVVFDGVRAVGVEVRRPDGTVERVDGGEVVLSAGALHTPALLLRSGVGPAADLRKLAVPVVADVPGVGGNLAEHAALTVSAWLAPEARFNETTRRHNAIYLRYSSNVSGCPASDMLVNFVCRSAWHAIGRRLGTMQSQILLPYSRGTVRLASADPDAEPAVRFDLLSDPRDRLRMADAFRRMVALFATPAVAAVARDPFASSLSDRVRAIGADTPRNRILSAVVAGLLDGPSPLRRLTIGRAIADGPAIASLLADEPALDAHLTRAVTGVWHPAGTCRMGRADDPMAVTDSAGRVRGVRGLRVADASLMPDLPRANTNLPCMMIGERIAEFMLGQS